MNTPHTPVPADPREDALRLWLRTQPAGQEVRPESLRLAAADASVRRYWRGVSTTGTSWVIMDSPPDRQPTAAFVAMADRLAQAGLPAPRVHARDDAQGFLLLDDLGNDLLLTKLQTLQRDAATAPAEALMREAVQLLVRWQTQLATHDLPVYDAAFVQRELDIFDEWCVQAHAGVTWTAEQRQQWQTVCTRIAQVVLAGERTVMHRDYMPRNLMCTPQGLAILDFQDAVVGPYSYDIASLLRDAFISWPEDMEIDLAVRYWESARRAKLPVPDDFGAFWRQVEWTGLQRHLKVLGIFCRLKLRDGKPAYAEDLPRFFNYAYKVASRYQGLGPLAHLLEPLMGAQRVDAFY